MDNNQSSYKNKSFIQLESVGVELLLTTNKTNKKNNITICITTYKRQEELLSAVNSALQQNQQGYELIIVSNDPDFEICNELRVMILGSPIHTKVFRNQSNIGSFQNWNRCSLLTTTKHFTILHDDDFLFPTFIKDSSKLLKKMDNFVFRTHINKDPKSKFNKVFESSFVKKLNYNDLLHFHVTNGLGMVINRETFIAFGGYNPDNFPFADHLFNLDFVTDYELFYIKKTNSSYTYKIRTDSDEYYESALKLRLILEQYINKKIANRLVRNFKLLLVDLDYKYKLLRHVNKQDDFRFKLKLRQTIITYIYGLFRKLERTIKY